MNFKKVMTLSVLLFLLAMTCNCASMFHGTRQDLAIHSEPQGAIAFTDKGHKCRTPCQISVKRKDPPLMITFEKEG